MSHGPCAAAAATAATASATAACMSSRTLTEGALAREALLDNLRSGRRPPPDVPRGPPQCGSGVRDAPHAGAYGAAAGHTGPGAGVASFSFTAHNSHELSLTPHEAISEASDVGGGWMLGKRSSDGCRGLFPSSHVSMPHGVATLPCLPAELAALSADLGITPAGLSSAAEPPIDASEAQVAAVALKAAAVVVLEESDS